MVCASIFTFIRKMFERQIGDISLCLFSNIDEVFLLERGIAGKRRSRFVLASPIVTAVRPLLAAGKRAGIPEQNRPSARLRQDSPISPSTT
jgi:hypothetical protein